MQKLHNKGLKFKLIICIITAIMLCNFAVPNFAYAKTDPDDGGDLLKAIDQFVAYLGDKVMEWLQNSFTTEAPIENIDGTYNFQYSPAIIFSGGVKALDINFIKPNNLPNLPATESVNYTEEMIREKLSTIRDKANECDDPEEGFEDKLKADGYSSFVRQADMLTTYYVFYTEDKLIVYIHNGGYVKSRKTVV